MSVIVVGLNHRTVPLDMLERMAVTDAALPKALHDLQSRPNLSEAVVLSTCNRTEIYAVAERYHGAVSDVRNFLAELSYFPVENFTDHLYAYHDDVAVAHLFKVASGLDSAVVGESEILGQVRAAWDQARDEGATGAVLDRLFPRAVEVGRRARRETAISRGTTSVSQAAVAMATQRLNGLTGRTVLVLGAGEMGEGIVRALASSGVGELLISNRTWQRAVDLAERVGGTPVSFGAIAAALERADLLLTSTGAPDLIIEAVDLSPVLETRPRRPLLIVDVAVPRDVDPAVGSLSGVTLLDMDDIRAFADAGLEGRHREVARVQAIVNEEVDNYERELDVRDLAPLIAAFRDRAEHIRIEEIERHRARLGDLDERQRVALESLTRGLVNKLLHEPTVRLRQDAGTARGERIAEALRILFDL